VKDYTLKPIPEGWQQVIEAQNAAYPKCKHGTPTAFIINDRPICAECYAEDPALRAFLRSNMLVSGGLR